MKFRSVKILALVCTLLCGYAAGAPLTASDSTATTARPGDVNFDNSLDVFDLLAVLREIKVVEPRPEADLNGSGKVDIYDLLALLQALAD